MLALSHPELPTCADCQTWLYGPDWRIVERGGEPVRRPRGSPLPCRRCPKSGTSQPNPDAELLTVNWQAYDYYLQCEADQTGILPRDRLVVANNALVRLAHRHHDRALSSGQAALQALLGALVKGR